MLRMNLKLWVLPPPSSLLFYYHIIIIITIIIITIAVIVTQSKKYFFSEIDTRSDKSLKIEIFQKQNFFFPSSPHSSSSFFSFFCFLVPHSLWYFQNQWKQTIFGWHNRVSISIVKRFRSRRLVVRVASGFAVRIWFGFRFRIFE